MSAPKHTAGPWTVDVQSNHTNVEAPHFTVAADVTNEDAHLIAAAPDMVAILRELVADFPVTLAAGGFKQRIDAILARAEGGR